MTARNVGSILLICTLLFFVWKKYSTFDEPNLSEQDRTSTDYSTLPLIDAQFTLPLNYGQTLAPDIEMKNPFAPLFVEELEEVGELEEIQNIDEAIELATSPTIDTATDVEIAEPISETETTNPNLLTVFGNLPFPQIPKFVESNSEPKIETITSQPELITVIPEQNVDPIASLPAIKIRSSKEDLVVKPEVDTVRSSSPTPPNVTYRGSLKTDKQTIAFIQVDDINQTITQGSAIQDGWEVVNISENTLTIQHLPTNTQALIKR